MHETSDAAQYVRDQEFTTTKFSGTEGVLEKL